MAFTTIGVLAAAAIAGAVATGTTAIVQGAKGSKKGPGMGDLPKAPGMGEVADKATDRSNKRRASASKSVYSSPLGLSGQANVARKTLLGQ